MNKKRLILLILVILGVWYFWGRGPAQNFPADNSSGAQSAGQENSGGQGEESDEARPSLSSDDGNLDVARVHYFTKEALASCSTETTAVEQAVDPKYGHRAAGALVVMTLPMSAEQAAQYESSLPAGARLLTMQINKDGIATADYNSALGAEAAPCVKAERRAQIERTLKEFSEIKNVVITVEGKVWE